MKTLSPLAALLSAAVFSSAHAQQAEVVDLSAPQSGPVVQTPIVLAQPSVVEDASAMIVEEEAPNSGDLYFQMQTLQREVMALRNVVELQSRQLQELRQLSLQRYIELDRRLASGAVVLPEEDSSLEVGVDPQSNVAAADDVAVSTPDTPNKSDIEFYDEAYQLVKGRQYDQAIPQFEQFLAQYPNSVRQANAYYWLGSLYMVVDQLSQAELRLTELLDKFPEHAKIPDASYKLATLYFKLGKREESRQLLEDIKAKYATSNSNTVKLATAFLRDNF